MIYFARSLETGYIKIGMTAGIWRRIAALSNQHGELEVLGVLPGGRPFEKALHMAFDAHLVPGMGREWFYDIAAIREYIKRYTHLPESYTPRQQPRPLRLNMPEYRQGVNCHLYDLIVNKRQQAGFEGFGIHELADATGISAGRIKQLALNKCDKYRSAEMDTLIDFFGCQVNDILRISGVDWLQ